jgi:hypothetical protein
MVFFDDTKPVHRKRDPRLVGHSRIPEYFWAIPGSGVTRHQGSRLVADLSVST